MVQLVNEINGITKSTALNWRHVLACLVQARTAWLVRYGRFEKTRFVTYMKCMTPAVPLCLITNAEPILEDWVGRSDVEFALVSNEAKAMLATGKRRADKKLRANLWKRVDGYLNDNRYVSSTQLRWWVIEIEAGVRKRSSLTRYRLKYGTDLIEFRCNKSGLTDDEIIERINDLLDNSEDEFEEVQKRKSPNK